jgi:tetratricopeptide (TPR) repeat protein
MVFTFYSFKGGVGRSMALANVAELLARRGLDVLMVDMDLEAPGLERFFEGEGGSTTASEVERRRGMIDLLTSYKDLRDLPRFDEEETGSTETNPHGLVVEPLDAFVTLVSERSDKRGRLQLISAGRRAGEAFTNYADLVRAFDWDAFYRRFDGEAFFDWFREESAQLADVVLVDSRTGITELSGVCTFHLADAVVMFVAPNKQNLEGCALMAESLSNPELVSDGRRGRSLAILPVPSRIDHSESEQLDVFSEEFSTRIGGYAAPQLTFENSLFIDLKVPYVPAYAYREAVAVRESGRAVATELVGAYQRLAASMVDLAPRRSSLRRVFHSGRSTVDERSVRAQDVVERRWVVEGVTKWLMAGNESTLLLTGPPGSGKTTFVRWLAELGGVVLAEAVDSEPAAIVGAFYCDAYDERGLDARLFVETLVRRLGAILPEYAQLLAASEQAGIAVEITRPISATNRTQAEIGEVSLGRRSATSAFDELIRRPIEELGVTIPPRLLVLVDGIDVAGSDHADESLVELLAHISAISPPMQIRLLLTSRHDPWILERIGARSLDLVGDGPAREDVRRFALARLQELPDGRQAALAEDVADASGGNFAFARAALDVLGTQIAQRGGSRGLGESAPDLTVTELPEALARIYNEELSRLLGPGLASWQSDRRLLGVLAVAREPLASSQLPGILDWSTSTLDEALQRWGQFLASGPHGTVTLFHSSFRRFLLNHDVFRVYADQADVALARYFAANTRTWLAAKDSYGLRHAPAHLFAALAETSDGSLRVEAASILASLVNSDFLDAKAERLGPSALREDLLAGSEVLGGLSHIQPLAQTLLVDMDRLAFDRAAGHGSGSEAVSYQKGMFAAVGEVVANAYASAYEWIRAVMSSGRERTAMMSTLVNEVALLAEHGLVDAVAVGDLMAGGEGERIVGLALLQARPDPSQFAAVCDVIGGSITAFEQFHALRVAGLLVPTIDGRERVMLVTVLEREARDERGLDVMGDTSRSRQISELLARVRTSSSVPDGDGYDERLDSHLRALDLAQELGDRRGIIASYRNLGVVAHSRGEYRQALDYHMHALRIAEELGDRASVAASHHQLGIIAGERGQQQDALEHNLRALQIGEELGDRAGVAASHYQLGIVGEHDGRYDDALAHHREALRIAEELDNGAQQAVALTHIGLILAREDPASGVPSLVNGLMRHLSLGLPGADVPIQWLTHQRTLMGKDAFVAALEEIVEPGAARAIVEMTNPQR